MAISEKNNQQTNNGVLIPGYETTFITRVELSEELLEQIKNKIVDTVKNFGGEVIWTEDWGKRRLAYPIQREKRGRYTYAVYSGKPGVVFEIERFLKIQESVLRYLTINLDKEFDPAAYRQKRLKQKEATKRREEEERTSHHRQ